MIQSEQSGEVKSHYDASSASIAIVSDHIPVDNQAWTTVTRTSRHSPSKDSSFLKEGMNSSSRFKVLVDLPEE